MPDSTAAALAAELEERALLIHQKSYRGGSRSEFYDSCARSFIGLLAGPLAKEIADLSELHGRPVGKVAGAAVKALAALQTAITEFNEDYQ